MESTLPEPTQDDRTMALMAHLLQIFTGFLGPLVIYFLRRQSRFVAFHSLQALFWQILVTALYIVGALLMVFTMVAGNAQGGGQGPSGGTIALFVLFWVATFLVSIVNLVVAVYFTVKASKGEWAENPLVARWARRAAGI
jgi:uncharacterized Tic20 family protein